MFSSLYLFYWVLTLTSVSHDSNRALLFHKSDNILRYMDGWDYRSGDSNWFILNSVSCPKTVGCFSGCASKCQQGLADRLCGQKIDVQFGRQRIADTRD
ncbi:hypothetical protein ACXKGW_28945, partial [Klebsiella pneumoniae subsp. pneumoniae]